MDYRNDLMIDELLAFAFDVESEESEEAENALRNWALVKV